MAILYILYAALSLNSICSYLFSCLSILIRAHFAFIFTLLFHFILFYFICTFIFILILIFIFIFVFFFFLILTLDAIGPPSSRRNGFGKQVKDVFRKSKEEVKNLIDEVEDKDKGTDKIKSNKMK